MQPYSEKSKCGACGSDYIISTAFRPVTGPTGEDLSYIKRRCTRCGYVWRETPLYKAQERCGLPMTKIIVEIEYDQPEDPYWLNPDNVAMCLHAYCENTKFKVRWARGGNPWRKEAEPNR